MHAAAGVSHSPGTISRLALRHIFNLEFLTPGDSTRLNLYLFAVYRRLRRLVLSLNGLNVWLHINERVSEEIVWGWIRARCGFLRR